MFYGAVLQIFVLYNGVPVTAVHSRGVCPVAHDGALVEVAHRQLVRQVVGARARGETRGRDGLEEVVHGTRMVTHWS